MAPRVQFYHNTPDRLVLTRELVANAHERGRKIAICCTDAAQLKRLDQLLWTAEPLSFIPHVAIESALAGETPVVLAVAGAETPWPHTDLLFNLADDLIEAFRPLVDLHVFRHHATTEGDLNPQDKAALIALLNVDMAMPQGRMSALSAIEYTVESLVRLFEDENTALELPILIGLDAHLLEC